MSNEERRDEAELLRRTVSIAPEQLRGARHRMKARNRAVAEERAAAAREKATQAMRPVAGLSVAVFECPECGALVTQRDKHVRWHETAAAAILEQIRRNRLTF